MKLYKYIKFHNCLEISGVHNSLALHCMLVGKKMLSIIVEKGLMDSFGPGVSSGGPE